jgi:hypothetical protein
MKKETLEDMVVGEEEEEEEEEMATLIDYLDMMR